MPTFRITSPDGKTFDVTGPEGSTAEQALAQVQAQHAAPPAEGSRARAAKTSDGLLTTAAANVPPGAIRGAGSIGATLMAPIDMGADAVAAAMGEPTGSQPANQQRRADMDSALTNLGADPSNPGFKFGKVGAEIAGTLGVGGGLAKTATAVAPALAAKAPALVNAVRTGGMAAGPAAPGAVGAAANLATRAAGGAVTGGAASGAVDPTQAGVGAVIGGALPIAAKVAGAVGNGVGRAIGGPPQAADLAKAIADARAAGFVIPPSQARPNIVNRAIEGFAGKVSTAQNASARNAETAANLAAQDLGLPAGTKITPGVLDGIRDRAGQAYKAIGSTGVITPSPVYEQALDAIQQPYLLTAGAFPGAPPSPVVKLVDQMRTPAFASAAAVEKIKQLRSVAKDNFRPGGDTDVARAARDLSDALENAVEEHLQKIGQAPLLQQFRDARQLIAKTYSVENALNAETGSVSARNLASQLDAGKPLSGGLEQAARFAARFPKAAQPVEGMGSLPQTSPLDWHAASAMSLATGNPMPMMSVAARPIARSLALSPAVQNRLVQPTGPNPIAMLFANPGVQQLGYRSAPVALSGR